MKNLHLIHVLKEKKICELLKQYNFSFDLQVFVLEPERTREAYERPFIEDGVFLRDISKLSLPFPEIYIEAPDDDTFIFNGITHDNQKELVFVCDCFWFKEITPEKICFVMYGRKDKDPRSQPYTYHGVLDLTKRQYEKYDSYAIALNTMIGFCERIHNESMGLEKHNRQYPMKVGSHKYSIGVPHIIRLAPKQTRHEVMPVLARNIEWQHHWWCRGHWRQKPGGIGKDRLGNYTMQNFTWVVPHRKGNKAGPEIKNIYMVGRQ